MQVRAWLEEQQESVMTVQGQCSPAATCLPQCRIEAPSELVAGSSHSPEHLNLMATPAAGLKQGVCQTGFHGISDGSRLEACSRLEGWEMHKLYASAARHAAAWRV